MKATFLLGAASVLFKSRKAQIVLVGLQIGFLVYKLINDNNQKNLKPVKR